MRRQIADSTADFDVLVHPARIVPNRRLEETYRLVALPAAVLHFAPEKKISPGNAIRISPGVTNHSRDFLTHLRRSTLIRVDDENPRIGRSLDREVALHADGLEGIRYHRSPCTSRQRRSVIGRSVFNYKNLTRECDTGDAVSDVVRLVPGSYDDSEWINHVALCVA